MNPRGSQAAGGPDRGATRLVLAGVAASLLSVLLALDRPLMELVARLRTPGAEPVALAVTSLGWGPVALAIAAGLAIAGWAARRRRIAGLGVHALGAVAASGLLVQAAKVIFGRVRPDGGALAGAFQFFSLHGGASFPSGHATAAFALAAVLAHAHPRWRWAGYGGALLVALSRVYLNKHFPADAFAGALLGAAVGHLAGQWLDRRQGREDERGTTETRRHGGER